MNQSRRLAAFWRSRVPLVLVLLSGLLVAVAYVLGLPHLQAANEPYLEPGNLYGPRLVDLTIASWCFWVGSAIGSFLNVVAWRMPRGKSINGRSHCPRCQTTLKSRDNFPVFGWLMLAGRCRTCKLPISKRYPIVELVIGLSLLLVGISEIYALSLPYQTDYGHGSSLWAPRITPVVLSIFFYHVFGITISFAFGLIRFDRMRLPGRLVAWGGLPLMIAMIGFPFLMMVSWRALGDTMPPVLTGISAHIDGGIRVVTALAVAAITGRSLARGLCPAADPKLDPLGNSTARLMDLICILMVPAILVGWQALLAIVVMTSVLATIANRTCLTATDRLGSFAVILPVVLSLHISRWRMLHELPWWPSDNSTPEVLVAWGALVLITPIWLRESPVHHSSSRPPENDLEEEIIEHAPTAFLNHGRNTAEHPQCHHPKSDNTTDNDEIRSTEVIDE